MKKIILRPLIFIYIFTSTFLYAGDIPDPPLAGDTVTSGDTGTPGAPASIPVDMYVYVLAIVAIMLIVFYTKKYKSQKI